jgi:hypothetical protein
MADPGASLITAFDYVWQRFTDRLSGMSDEEYLWEPVRGCWTLRRGANRHWQLDGGGGGGPAPEPVPVTTIAWRIGHLAGVTVGGFADRLFADGTLTPTDLDYPAAVDELPAFLAEHYGAWRSGLAGLDEDGWLRPLGPSWGPYSEASTADLALHVFDEVVHHGAEVGLLRDLWQHRSELATTR